ncbi:MAG: hypothetical protein KJ714_09010 [Euryarchaeota archaeon]|nr:hypothetical protein [Euryarchaeota archaeon]
MRVFSDRIKLDGRYRDNVSEIVNAMVEVKKMAAAGIEEGAIQKELRWCFEKIKSDGRNDENKAADEAPKPPKTLLSHFGGE